MVQIKELPIEKLWCKGHIVPSPLYGNIQLFVLNIGLCMERLTILMYGILVRGVYHGLKLAQGSFSFYAWAIISLRVGAVSVPKVIFLQAAEFSGS